MNNRIMPANDAARSASTVDFQDQCSLGMDQAIGIEKDFLPTGVRLDFCVDKKTSWFAPVGKLFNVAAQAIGFCMEMRRSWRSLLAPQALSHVSTAASNPNRQSHPSPDELAYSMDIAIGPQHVAAPRSTAASRSVRIAEPQPTPDELAYSMDIALGQRFTAVPSSTIASNSDRQAPPPAEVPENNMEIAIGARAGG